MLSLCECVWDFQNSALWDTHWHALLSSKYFLTLKLFITAGHGQHTGIIEVFHSLILAYAPKRINYEPDTYTARIRLAVQDHNENVQRPVKRGDYFNVLEKWNAVWSVTQILLIKHYSISLNLPYLTDTSYHNVPIHEVNALRLGITKS